MQEETTDSAPEQTHQYKPTMLKASHKDMHQKDKSKQFVDNDEFYAEIVKYKETGKISNRLGEIIMKLVERFATQHYYRGYAFKEDMIAEAIAHNIANIGKFDTEKFKNPFSYFTQCTYFSFLGYIGREKRELYKKYKSTQTALMDMDDIESEFIPVFDDEKRVMSDFIDAYETSIKKEKNKKSAQPNPELEGVDVVKTYGNVLFNEFQEGQPIETGNDLESVGVYTKTKYHVLFDQDLDAMDLYDAGLTDEETNE